MLKQSSSRIKKVLAIFLTVLFVISVTAVTASADHDPGHWWHHDHEDVDHDHWWHHDHDDLDHGHWWHHEDSDKGHL
jgi:Spy/CpxP family protein refolding chaperone